MYGLLESDGSTAENEEPDIKQLRLASNTSERYLLMVGDGLTQMRAKQFSELIEETSHSFGPRHKVTVMLQKAMDQVTFIPGDLHGGSFHIMQVVYNLFYCALIQKVQAVLKWKRICGSDVSKCYQQATSLASIFATELERGVLDEYIKIVHHSVDRRRAFQRIHNAKKLAIHLAQGYRKWMEECRKDTTDKLTKILDPATIAAPMGIDADNDDEIEVEHINVDDVVEESAVKGIGNITKCSPNPLAIKNHDIILYAKSEMEKLNLKVVRVNERERRIRYNNMARDIGQSVMAHRDVGMGNEADVGTDSFMEVSLARHQEAHITGGCDEL